MHQPQVFYVDSYDNMNHGDNHGKMPKLWKRSQNPKENLEDGRQTRQEGKKDTTYHSALRLLWQDFPRSRGQEKNLEAELPNFLFSIFLFYFTIWVYPIFGLNPFTKTEKGGLILAGKARSKIENSMQNTQF
jgi:hypothetical protein